MTIAVMMDYEVEYLGPRPKAGEWNENGLICDHARDIMIIVSDNQCNENQSTMIF